MIKTAERKSASFFSRYCYILEYILHNRPTLLFLTHLSIKMDLYHSSCFNVSEYVLIDYEAHISFTRVESIGS